MIPPRASAVSLVPDLPIGPIQSGYTRVKILSTVDVLRVEVQNLEALDLTPIIDVKPVLKEVAEA